MNHSFKLKILTPDKKLFQGEALSLTLPTYAGEITVLKDHSPLISLISIGEITVRTEDGEEKFLVQNGVIDVKQKEKDNFEVVVLADQTIDTDASNLDEQIQRAKEAMKANNEDLDFAFEEGVIERSLFIKRMKNR